MTKMPKYISTTNACKLCKPMGATLAFRGIEGAMPFLHGSQGCATYMRRYIISHFNEPMDIASSSLGEKNAIFGGGPNLKLGLKNVAEKFKPQMIGIASTCLTETIGDDLPQLLSQFRAEVDDPSRLPTLVSVSTPSYSGTHMEGFHAAVRAVVDQVARGGKTTSRFNLLPGFISPEDIRHLKEIGQEWKLNLTILPDISQTLDGPALLDYEKMPSGGTTLKEIKAMGRARSSIQFGRTIEQKDSAAQLLHDRFQVPKFTRGLPLGLRESDNFFSLLADLSGKPVPAKYIEERGRLIDSLADGHKYVFGKRAIVYGEEDLVAGLAAFLTEIGITPVLCASGGKSGRMKEAIKAACGDLMPEEMEIHEDVDFFQIAEKAEELQPDMVIGHSKGYHLARKLSIPLLRVGFPIHDRIGGQRMLHIGYKGAQQLFDRICNSFLEKKQEDSPIGYSYM